MALPTPTSATATTDYIAAGVRRYLLVPTIATLTAPTSAEITAGVDYAPVITALDGWTYSVDDVDNGTYGATFNSSVPGLSSSDSSSWTLKASRTSTDARSALTIGLNSFVVNANEGLVASAKMDVWPVRIKSVYTMQGGRGDLATIMCQFSIYAQPVLQVPVPSS